MEIYQIQKTVDTLNSRSERLSRRSMFPTMTRASLRHTNSPSGSLPPRTHFSEFRAYVQSNLQIGTDCEGKPKKYIRYDVLVSFWTREKVASVLQTELGERANLIPRDLLRSHYLRVFSILVYISSRNSSFVDEIIGLYSAKVYDDRLPSEEPRERLSRDTWFSFDENQWAFCPIHLKLNGSLHQKLDPRTIFAAKQREPTSIGRPASKGLGPLDARFKFLELEKNPTQGRGGSQIVRKEIFMAHLMLMVLDRDGSGQVVPFGGVASIRQRDTLLRSIRTKHSPTARNTPMPGLLFLRFQDGGPNS